MIAQATAIKPVEAKTCSTCQHFNDFNEPNGRGWCEQFDHQARKHHLKTNDCILSSPANSLEAFPTEVIELDRNGYPMGEQTVPNAYFSDDFVTLENEPF